MWLIILIVVHFQKHETAFYGLPQWQCGNAHLWWVAACSTKKSTTRTMNPKNGKKYVSRGDPSRIWSRKCKFTGSPLRACDNHGHDHLGREFIHLNVSLDTHINITQTIYFKHCLLHVFTYPCVYEIGGGAKNMTWYDPPPTLFNIDTKPHPHGTLKARSRCQRSPYWPWKKMAPRWKNWQFLLPSERSSAILPWIFTTKNIHVCESFMWVYPGSPTTIFYSLVSEPPLF